MNERADRDRTSGATGAAPSTIENPGPGHDMQSGQGIGGHQDDNDGLLAEQTPGLDPEATRREAGPDWDADVTTGDIEADEVEADGSSG